MSCDTWIDFNGQILHRHVVVDGLQDRLGFYLVGELLLPGQNLRHVGMVEGIAERGQFVFSRLATHDSEGFFDGFFNGVTDRINLTCPQYFVYLLAEQFLFFRVVVHAVHADNKSAILQFQAVKYGVFGNGFTVEGNARQNAVCADNRVVVDVAVLDICTGIYGCLTADIAVADCVRSCIIVRTDIAAPTEETVGIHLFDHEGKKLSGRTKVNKGRR